MAKKGYRVIAPDRYLRVREEPAEVTVRVGDEIVARSARAVRLGEGDRPEVLYLPREDVDFERLVPSDRTYDCRWKGRARYFHVDLLDRTLENVVWGYPDAPDAVAALRDRVAFDASAFAVEIGASPSSPSDGARSRPDGDAESVDAATAETVEGERGA